MGLFDYIRCEAQMPTSDMIGRLFQTKFRDDPFMELFVITADGRLIHHACDYDLQIDETKEGLFALLGALKSINKREVEVPYHGDIEFYGPTDDQPGEKGDYVARFTEGRLTSIRMERP